MTTELCLCMSNLKFVAFSQALVIYLSLVTSCGNYRKPVHVTEGQVDSEK